MKKGIYLFLALLIVACSDDGSDDNDSTAPIITILGDANITIDVGTTYTDAGATAIDNIDGDITSSIITNGIIPINSIGSYAVTYSVSDAAGNTATASRSVIVATPFIPMQEQFVGEWDKSFSYKQLAFRADGTGFEYDNNSGMFVQLTWSVTETELSIQYEGMGTAPFGYRYQVDQITGIMMVFTSLPDASIEFKYFRIE